jgi:aryl-alcohol dehydrogenase (NADP+)
MAQLKEDIDTVGVALNDEVLAEIDAIHLRYPNPAI